MSFDRRPTPKDDLFEVMSDAWCKVPAIYLDSLIEGLPRTYRLVPENDGLPIENQVFFSTPIGSKGSRTPVVAMSV